MLRIAQYGLSQQATQDANDAADLANKKLGLALQALIDANNAIDNVASTLAEKVDKETGKSPLLADTEITRLASVTNQTIEGLVWVVKRYLTKRKRKPSPNSETDYPSGR